MHLPPTKTPSTGDERLVIAAQPPGKLSELFELELFELIEGEVKLPGFSAAACELFGE